VANQILDEERALPTVDYETTAPASSVTAKNAVRTIAETLRQEVGDKLRVTSISRGLSKRT